ncbi:MAG: LicD family protein, partial [Lachnospiraceae bacterium]|nr:LicD family protein [Lachnospiraceae bacterium]
KEYLDLAGGEATGIIKVKAAIGAPFSISRKFWLRFANGVFSMYKNDDSEYVVVPTGRRHFKGEIYKRSDFAVGREVTFEGERVLVPKETKAYLERLFGSSYMELPPEEKREHHMVYEMELGHGAKED